MKKVYLFLVSALLVITSAQLSGQCSLYPVTLSNRVNNSALVVEATVVASKSFWNAEGNYIYTSNLLNVTQVLKGSLSVSQIEVITEGGEIGMRKQVVEPSLQLTIGNSGVFMLNSFNVPSQYGTPVYQTYADEQGFIKFNFDEDFAKEPFKKYQGINTELVSDLQTALNKTVSFTSSSNTTAKFSSPSSVAAITGISPTTITAGTSSVLTITGTGFGTTQGTSFVEFYNADDGGATYIKPHASHYVSWNSTQIQVMVPTKASTVCGTAGTGPVRVTVAGSPTVSAQTLTVNYGEINVYYSNTLTTQQVFDTRHVALDGAGGIKWQMYTGFDANATAKASFIRAFNTWRCNTLINWKLGAPISTNTITSDGVNVIRFDVGSELPAGVLGRCTSYFSGCSLGANVYFYVSELDICFDDATNWQFGPTNATGSQFDFESVAVHELGHGHQLSHVINTSDFMHYAISNAQNKRTPVANNIAAGNDVMTRNLSGGVCSQGTMTQIAASTCSLTAPTASFNIVTPVCAGQAITLTDLSSGVPTNWSWTMTGGSPATSTLQNTSTSYTGPGTYTVSLIATNGVGSSSAFSKTVTIVGTPTIAVTSNTICSGASGTLSASGATSYTWNPGGLTGATQTVSPGSTQVYNVTGSNGTCSNTANGTMSVTATPTVSIPNAAICVGGSTVITATGAGTYTWNPGNLSGATQTLNPGSTATYTVVGKTGNCTSANKIFTITVNGIPTVSATTSQSMICIGQSATLTSSGATSYTYNPGSVTSNPASVSPTVNTTYTVTGQTAGCNGTTTVMVSVSPCTGINQLTGEANFIVYPNPTQSDVTINFNGGFTGQVSLFNSIGQMLQRKTITGSSETKLSLSELPTGIYVIKFSQNNGSEKVIKVTKQ